jgi:hypothetical protein
MNPETLEALKGSIEKWRKIVEEGEINRASNDCPLCAMFIRADCEGCPIKQATAQRFCKGTPYFDFEYWDDDAYEANQTGRADTDDKMVAARAELDFLRSLLPKEVES